MRTLKILLVLLAVVFCGFSKDSHRTTNGVTVPIKFEGVIIATDNSDVIVCTPLGYPYPTISHSRKGWLEGNQSHGGRLNTELSTWTIFNCHTDFSSKINSSYIEGLNTVANGDAYSYICTMLVNISTFEVTLYVTIDGGTGRFEGATGQMTLTGFHPGTGLIPVQGWGSITFSK
ncbi:MAG: hypothetical protein JXR67_07690 [Bacteroidales bacterium]|nr:hypothetical protein [Bacteroidales bacterium]